jgi:hypothetical protein
MSSGLIKPIVSVAIVCAPPDWDKKSIENPRIKLRRINRV